LLHATLLNAFAAGLRLPYARNWWTSASPALPVTFIPSPFEERQ